MEKSTAVRQITPLGYTPFSLPNVCIRKVFRTSQLFYLFSRLTFPKWVTLIIMHFLKRGCMGRHQGEKSNVSAAECIFAQQKVKYPGLDGKYSSFCLLTRGTNSNMQTSKHLLAFTLLNQKRLHHSRIRYGPVLVLSLIFLLHGKEQSWLHLLYFSIRQLETDCPPLSHVEQFTAGQTWSRIITVKLFLASTSLLRLCSLISKSVEGSHCALQCRSPYTIDSHAYLQHCGSLDCAAGTG